MKRILIVGADEECHDIEYRVKLEHQIKESLEFSRTDTQHEAQIRLAARQFDAVVLARATTVSGYVAPSEAASLLFQGFLRQQGVFCVVVDDGAWLQSLIERLSR